MKKTEIKTKRMLLRPMTDEEIEALSERTDSEELRAAYSEMLDGCRRDPEDRIWYAPWEMTLKDSQEHVGEIGFKGPVKNHSVEIGYGVMPEHEGNGYASEALRAMTQWAFGQKEVVFIEAETAPDNAASKRVLEKCGFAPDGTGEEGAAFRAGEPAYELVDDLYALRHCHRNVHRADARANALGHGDRHEPRRPCRYGAQQHREEKTRCAPPAA